MNMYLDRAMRSHDPRFASILAILGMGRETDDLPALRSEYRRIFGKRPFNGWSADVLRQKISGKGQAE